MAGDTARAIQQSSYSPTPWWWRAAIFAAVVVGGYSTYLLRSRDLIDLKMQSAVGIFCLIGFAACLSKNLRAVNWRTILFGFSLQLWLGIMILRWSLFGMEGIGIPDGYRPGYALFEAAGQAVQKFIDFSNVGADFVFGKLADPQAMEETLGPGNGVVVAFRVLPPIVFISSFFTVLYYFGVLQFIVRIMARIMMNLMRTSGAETLSAAANVFMGQTEAPLIVKPYISRMTQSELLALMAGGMATIAGSLLVVYASFGADRVALLATSVMAAPCSLYLAKLILPETEVPETSGSLQIADERPHANAIDAAAAGASDGIKLAINVAAMLIAFLALLAMANFLLGQLATGQPLWQTMNSPPAGWDLAWWGIFNALLLIGGYVVICLIANAITKRVGPRRPLLYVLGDDTTAQKIGNFAILIVGFTVFVVAMNYLLAWLPPHLELKHIFSAVFSPLAFMIGVSAKDIPAIADLLGTKIAANEFVAFSELSRLKADNQLTPRSIVLASYALTGFANFGSVGIQIGGIGAMAPDRRSDLARLGMRALLVGFLVTCINAAVAGMLLDVAETRE